MTAESKNLTYTRMGEILVFDFLASHGVISSQTFLSTYVVEMAGEQKAKKMFDSVRKLRLQ